MKREEALARARLQQHKDNISQAELNLEKMAMKLGVASELQSVKIESRKLQIARPPRGPRPTE